ncbi:MAG: hypothetical protein ACRDTH_20265 [Pseudonocardiaceae bacterium]
MPLTFRNIDTTPDDPVETWPLESVITALERGGLSHRRRLAAAIKADPWGPVTRAVIEALSVTPSAAFMVRMRRMAHAQRARDEKPESPRRREDTAGPP